MYNNSLDMSDYTLFIYYNLYKRIRWICQIILCSFIIKYRGNEHVKVYMYFVVNCA